MLMLNKQNLSPEDPRSGQALWIANQMVIDLSLLDYVQLLFTVSITQLMKLGQRMLPRRSEYLREGSRDSFTILCV